MKLTTGVIYRQTSRRSRVSCGIPMVVLGERTVYSYHRLLCVPPPGDSPPGSGRPRVPVPGDIVVVTIPNGSQEFRASAQRLVDEWWLRMEPSRAAIVEPLAKLVDRLSAVVAAEPDVEKAQLLGEAVTACSKAHIALEHAICPGFDHPIGISSGGSLQIEHRAMATPECPLGEMLDHGLLVDLDWVLVEEIC